MLHSLFQTKDRRVWKGFSSTQNIPSAVSQSSYTRSKAPSTIRKVQSVVNLITGTNGSNQESFAEVFSFFNGSRQGNTSVCSQLSLSSFDETEQSTAVDTSNFLLNKATSLQHLHTHTSVGGNPSPLDYRTFDFPSSPSEASTVVHGDLELSQSSEGRTPSHSLHCRRFESVSTAAHSQPHATEDDVFLSNPFSPVHLSNAPTQPRIDHTGIINSTTSSQDTLAAFYASPERDATYQFSLTQKSEDSYPSYSLDRRKYAQRLKTVESEGCFTQEVDKDTCNSEDTATLDTVATHLSVVEDSNLAETEPVDIPVTNPSVPHHSIHIGGAESPSSFLVKHTRIHVHHVHVPHSVVYDSLHKYLSLSTLLISALVSKGAKYSDT